MTAFTSAPSYNSFGLQEPWQTYQGGPSEQWSMQHPPQHHLQHGQPGLDANGAAGFAPHQAPVPHGAQGAYNGPSAPPSMPPSPMAAMGWNIMKRLDFRPANEQEYFGINGFEGVPAGQDAGHLWDAHADQGMNGNHFAMQPGQQHAQGHGGEVPAANLQPESGAGAAGMRVIAVPMGQHPPDGAVPIGEYTVGQEQAQMQAPQPPMQAPVSPMQAPQAPMQTPQAPMQAPQVPPGAPMSTPNGYQQIAVPLGMGATLPEGAIPLYCCEVPGQELGSGQGLPSLPMGQSAEGAVQKTVRQPFKIIDPRTGEEMNMGLNTPSNGKTTGLPAQMIEPSGGETMSPDSKTTKSKKFQIVDPRTGQSVSPINNSKDTADGPNKGIGVQSKSIGGQGKGFQIINPKTGQQVTSAAKEKSGKPGKSVRILNPKTGRPEFPHDPTVPVPAG